MAKPTKAEEENSKRKAKEESEAASAAKKLAEEGFNLTSALSKTTIEAKTSTILAIRELTQKIEKNTTLVGKISRKSFVRDFEGGKMFSFDLMDTTDTIRTTVFGKIPSFDEIYMKIKVNGNIQVSNFKVVKKNPKYNTLSNENEISWLPETTLKFIPDDSQSCPEITFHFTTLDKVLTSDLAKPLDTVAVASYIGELENVNNGPLRRITLVDESGSTIRLNLWKHAATESAFELGTIIALKDCQVKSNTFQDNTEITLGLTVNTLFWPYPCIARAQELKVWMNRRISELN